MPDLDVTRASSGDDPPGPGPAAWTLAGAGLTALLYSLDAADPLVAGMAVPAALGLGLAVYDFFWRPLRDARAAGRRRHADAAAGAPPAFVDTQAGWRQPSS
ncbi:hypothetical protein HLB44_24590 [Aquincola sp. S2]|uniref:Uncharacterized protein n=2 Tax=Pseudaquabacterium terrae TaxID=2732868 RepID=A0ABX2ENH7_9BURK|nr:hypothetical protein [Aquabacterium terrae]